MKPRAIIIVVTLILFCTNFFSFISFNHNCIATPVTLYVGDGKQYSTISAAIENASAGCRIFVYNGTYYENITIDKKLDLFGEDRSITIINGNGYDNVVVVNASNVNISHFTIKNGGTTIDDSIIRVNYRNSIITDNIISHGYHGIILNNSDGHLIYDNIIRYNTGDGVRLNQSDNNVNISYNTITLNNNGIYLYSSDGNKIFNNDIQNNDASGIVLNNTCDNNYLVSNNASDNNIRGIFLNDFSNYSTISSNNIYSNNDSGIVLENSSINTINNCNIVCGNTNYGTMIIGSNNIVQNNTFSRNNKDGIYLTADDNNTVSSNTINNNTLSGIRLYNSTDDYIYDNEIYGNAGYGAYLDFFTLRNLVSNNYFHNNGQNAMDKSINRNRWNMTLTSTTNIVGGSYKSGNYWDDFDETSEGAIDTNGNGISDTSYTIYASNKDYGPLLDVTSPSIGTITSTPSAQSLGGYTNISVVVTDNLEVKNVYLIVTNPNSQTSNYSITQNRTGSTYYSNSQYSPVGSFSYSIAAVDSRNWATSTSRIFNITSGTAPTITDNSPTTGSPNSTFIFNATVIDDEDSALDISVNVIWSHGKLSANQSVINVGNNYFERSINLDNSIDSLSYHFFVQDKWGNSATSATKTVTIADTQAPEIKIKRYGTSFDDIPNSHTFAAEITDNTLVSNVYIEYWYDDKDIMTAPMRNDTSLGGSYYEKMVIPDGSPEKVYCIIYANDSSNNQNNTKNPHAKPGGPYTSFIQGDILFNGSESFDLDGAIENYSWDFGDGTVGFGSNPIHAYESDGNYTVTLTIIDNEERIGINTTTINISNIVPHKIPTSKLEQINITYNLTLTKQFYCYNESGRGAVNTFYDPNGELFPVHSGSINNSGIILFLLSIDNDDIPELFWDTSTDDIITVSHTIGVIENTSIDEENEQITYNVSVNKTGWIYIEIDDEYPYASLSVTTIDRTISSDLTWRKNNKIYVLDDPENIYQFIFQNIYPVVEAPSFSPSDGGVINEDNPTITITYNVPVKITSAIFGLFQIASNIDTSNNIVFTYTPLSYLENGTYNFDINAEALQGNSSISSSVVYIYFAYTNPPEESVIEKYWMWILFLVGIISIVSILAFFKYKQVTLDDFIYVKTKKIVPFFKTIILGPISVNIDNKEIAKAEFYVDGQLKESLSSPPFFWKWKERAFLKHTLETKVYDQEGNSASSGEKEFYIFNPINRLK